jgi:hypothetical protein
MHRVSSLRTIGYSSLFLLGGDRIVKDLDDAIKIGNQSSGLGCFPGGCRLKMTLMFHCACSKWSDLVQQRVARRVAQETLQKACQSAFKSSGEKVSVRSRSDDHLSMMEELVGQTPLLRCAAKRMTIINRADNQSHYATDVNQLDPPAFCSGSTRRALLIVSHWVCLGRRATAYMRGIGTLRGWKALRTYSGTKAVRTADPAQVAA